MNKKKGKERKCNPKVCPYKRLLIDMWRLDVLTSGEAEGKNLKKPSLEEILSRYFPYRSMLKKGP